jgi:C1A family cysteine protease
MRKFLVASTLVLSSAAPAEVEKAFQSFQNKFNKHYGTEQERASRLQIFADNLELAEQRNRDNIAAGGEAVHGVTRFSDLTTSEFKSRYLSSLRVNHANRAQRSSVDSGSLSNSTSLPSSIDWRTKNAVLPVENEGQCGATWAFSVKEAIESYAFINAKSALIQLSAQQMVSCDKVDAGCNGGEPDTAYQYVINTGGLESEESYPYVSENGTVPRCKFQQSKVVVSIKEYTMLPEGEAGLKAIVPQGPPSVCLSAESWSTYTGGVLTTCPGQMDHCVQVVGYDDTSKPPYWIARNQWSTAWGEQGYIRIAQGTNLCLIGNLASFPTF